LSTPAFYGKVKLTDHFVFGSVNNEILSHKEEGYKQLVDKAMKNGLQFTPQLAHRSAATLYRP